MSPHDTWSEGATYELFMGRWSRLIAPEFIDRLQARQHATWLDVGCGSGALSTAIAHQTSPELIVAFDPSLAFVRQVRRMQSIPGIRSFVADALRIPLADGVVDCVVSGLVLNFIEDLDATILEMERVTRADGEIAAYVWDYAGGMQMLQSFWDAAVMLDPTASDLDEKVRFADCTGDLLGRSFEQCALEHVTVDYITVDTTFSGFEDYWTPFEGGQGPAPSYVASLPQHQQTELKHLVHHNLNGGREGAIVLSASALTVRGRVTSA